MQQEGKPFAHNLLQAVVKCWLHVRLAGQLVICSPCSPVGLLLLLALLLLSVLKA
jgi:hypothetical protein